MATRTPKPPPFERRSLRGIVFDLDGTLVDSYEPITESLNHARAQHGLPPLGVEVIRSAVGGGLESLVARLVGPEHVESAVRAFRERYSEIHDRTRILAGVRPTVRRLAERGLRMSVASNKPARFGEAIVSRLGLRPHFDVVLGPDRAGNATKPDPILIRRCLAAMELDAREAVYVGDMVLDVESAARAGVAVVLVPGGSSPLHELRATGEILLDRFDDLLRLLL